MCARSVGNTTQRTTYGNLSAAQGKKYKKHAATRKNAKHIKWAKARHESDAVKGSESSYIIPRLRAALIKQTNSTQHTRQSTKMHKEHIHSALTAKCIKTRESFVHITLKL